MNTKIILKKAIKTLTYKLQESSKGSKRHNKKRKTEIRILAIAINCFILNYRESLSKIIHLHFICGMNCFICCY